jgi:hypothetical protein
MLIRVPASCKAFHVPSKLLIFSSIVIKVFVFATQGEGYNRLCNHVVILSLKPILKLFVCRYRIRLLLVSKSSSFSINNNSPSFLRQFRAFRIDCKLYRLWFSKINGLGSGITRGTRPWRRHKLIHIFHYYNDNTPKKINWDRISLR